MPGMAAADKHDTSPLVEFANVIVIKGEKKVLDGITLTIPRGENIAILGPNGAGKSSLVKAITREYYPVQTSRPFTFRVNGEETWDVFSLKSTIGIVSNDLQYTFTRSVTGREVILSGFFSSIGLFNHVITPAMEEKAGAVMQRLNIRHLADRPINAMSSGEARRFLIGRALVFDPRTLILDEPTNSLDLGALHAFRELVRTIAQSGTSVILVTHNLHDIIPEISRVVMIRDGRIFCDGRKEELLTDAAIGRLFSVPVHVVCSGGWHYATGY